ncbi:MAG: BrnA antitoxin family protein [Nanoarchaeota archaeon]|nr:BrnA antitoxin family protein [Nanoarchaeota archaeon]
MKKLKPMKPFKTLEEEANFWDTHDVSPFFDKKKVPLESLELIEKEKKEVLVIRVQKSVKKRIEKIAKAKGINPTTLSRMWLIEKLGQVTSNV